MMSRLFLCTLLCITSAAYSQVLPTPAVQHRNEGNLELPGKALTLPFSTFDTGTLLFLQGQFEKEGVQLRETDQDPFIKFHWTEFQKDEAYTLSIDSTVTISAQSARGRFNAMLTLLQLVEYSAHNTLLPKIFIEDEPAFSWRGLHLDVSRHFFSVDEVKRFLDLMAIYKFNTFHWHLTDDQGWRIEIEQYPRLTEVGAFRDSTLQGHYSDTPRIFEHQKYGGYYTKDQIKEVVAYAADLHINVVPEIELPGHSRAALAAYPEFSCTGDSLGVPGLWGVFNDIYCSKEATIQFLQDVLDEVLELFPSEYIHIGGDEAPKSRWEQCTSCKKVMVENNLKNTHELQSYFIQRIDAYLTEKGRKLIGWDEILEGGLSPNATVMSWRGESGGIQAARQGHEVVMSPTTYCYFDYYQSSHESEPLAIGGFLPLEKVYEFNSIPSVLSEDQAKFILGGQANVWTEYIKSFSEVEYMVYPRAIALMQSLWCTQKPSYDTFLRTYLTKHEDFLARRAVNFSRSVHLPKLKVERTSEGVAYSWTSIDSNQFFTLSSTLGNAVSGVSRLKNDEAVVFKPGTIDQRVTLSYGFAKDRQLNYHVHRSQALGAKVELLTEPHPKYNNNGSLNLVDGIQGSDRWKGDQWLGFRDTSISFIVDMDTVVDIERLTIGFLNKNGSWIYLPESVEIAVSSNGTDWEIVESIAIVEGNRIVRPEIVMDDTGRFIRVVVQPLNKIPNGNGGAGQVPWTFIDEIQVFTR